jgi:hypothetical protein
MAVAKTVFGGVPQAETGLREVIFAIFSKPDQVVVRGEVVRHHRGVPGLVRISSLRHVARVNCKVLF